MEAEHVFNGRYRVDSRLGIGGMAVVYRGTDLLLRRRVAIKVLLERFSSDADFIARFSNEAQAAARLSHPNIVNVYDYGSEGDAHYIVMELVEGETLADMLVDDRRLPEPVAIDYATQIAAGLAYAHRQGLLHRDIKPANILVTRDDVVKISDFGIARAVSGSESSVTQPGMVMGSVAYISPEQAQGHELDERSDLYSLGVVLYQMIAGRVPFSAETPVAVALQHVSAPPPRLDAAALGVSPALAAIVERLLRKDREGRYASATELGRALREAREQPTIAADGSRSGADAPTTTFQAVRAPQPPWRPSAAPDRPETVTATTVTERGGARRWLPLVLLLLIAVAAGYAAVGLFTPSKPVVLADLAGRSASQAKQDLAAAGLQARVESEASATVGQDRVVRTDPSAGSRVARHATVTLYVSSGPPSIDVPDVQGFTRADAEHTLVAAKLKAKIVEKYDKAAAGTVVAVTPKRTREGGTVTLTVSKGEAPVKVPQVVGMHVDAARAALAKKGLKLNVDQQTPSDLIPKDTIVSQSVGADGTAAPGATIGVTVSTGPMLTTVPDVTGKTPAAAQAALQAAGFAPRLQYIVDATNASGNVAAQDPAANATAPRRSTVTINVAVPGTVPDVSGMTLEDAKNAIGASGYSVGNVAMTQDGTEGKVARTEPEANATLRPGEAVTIYYHPSGAPPPQP